LALLRAGSAFAQYDYSGPIVARDGAFSCVGKTRADAENMFRNYFFGLLNRSTNTPMTVLCPLNRRNLFPYGKATTNVDSVLLLSVVIYVVQQPGSSAIACQVFAYSSRTGTAHVTSWVSSGATGYTSITFTDPFGTTALVDEGIVSIGYICTVPGSGSDITSYSLVGAEAKFAPN
jgi:hypothetical protein